MCHDVISAVFRILQKPELTREIDTESLEKLLPKELLDPLEEQYLNKQQVYYIFSVLVGLDFLVVEVPGTQ